MTTTGARRGRPPAGGREQILEAARLLLHERGIARLTTREVARRAGVSEGSVFYHFQDRFGLLRAVFEGGLRPLLDLNAAGIDAGGVRETLERFSAAVQGFLDTGLDVLLAAHGDAELRRSTAEFLAANDFGPHRGIEAVGSYLAAQQRLGTVRAGIDPHVVAYLVVSDAMERSVQPKLIAHSKGVPPQHAFFDTVMAMIAPPEPSS